MLLSRGLSLPFLLAACLAGFARADDDARDPVALAARIDQRISVGWKAAKVEPAGRCDDASFLRRVYLDISGRIPSVLEVRRFLADSAPDKRRLLVERLLDGPGYVRHFAGIWRNLLAPDAENDPGRRAAVAALDRWLRRQFAEDAGFDEIARGVLTVPADEAAGQPPAAGADEPSARLFYLVRKGKPEETAAAVSRLFLGVRLECAQCHDHPFARWKREQFWSQAAFFADLGASSKASLELPIPGTERIARPRFLDGAEPPVGQGDPRQRFADWLTKPDNPYFARAAVNRLWAHFFGIGIVDPVDDLSEANAPSHAELLDDLAAAFVASRYDMKVLIRAIVLSDAYQLDGAGRSGEPPDARLFSRRAAKMLSPEQFYDSFLEAAGVREPAASRLRPALLSRFPRPERPLDGQSSIPQALALMNGSFLSAATNPNGDNTLGAVVRGPFPDDAARIEALFLAALSRPPTQKERDFMIRHVAAADPAGKGQAFGDVFWALLNSAEFQFNH